MLAAMPLTSSLYSGFTGVAWAVELVDGLLGGDGEDRNGDIDEGADEAAAAVPGRTTWSTGSPG